jgi:hypothetical protein
MRRKIVAGVLALALPVGTIAATQSAAFAKKAPPNPETCHLSATVSISPPLSVKGVVAAKTAIGTTTVNVTYSSCTLAPGASGAVAPAGFTSHIVIQTKAGKDKNYKTDGNNKKLDYLGLCGAFASSSTTKDLGKAVKNLALPGGGSLKGAKAAEGTVGSEVGFNIVGTAKVGSYPTASKGASIAAGLVNDANNTNLINGCPSGPVSTIDIDPSTSTATL